MKKIKGAILVVFILLQILYTNVFAEDDYYVSPKLVDDLSLYPQHMYNRETALPSETKVIRDLKSNKIKFRVDSGYGFWKILNHQVGPMVFDIDMNGYSGNSAKMAVGAYDVEDKGRLPNLTEYHEIDNLYVTNGDSDVLLGHLKGFHRTLSETIFDVPSNALSYGVNNFRLDVDTEVVNGSYMGWVCGLTYASIEIPFNLDFISSRVEPEIEDSYAVLPEEIWSSTFDPETGNINEPSLDSDIKAGLKFDTDNSLRNIKYLYNIGAWEGNTFSELKYDYTWKIIKGNSEDYEVITEESGENTELNGEFTMLLPEIEGPYKLLINMNIFKGEEYIKSIEQIHNLNVVFSSKNVTDEQIDEYVESDDIIPYLPY
jgi:hypothetical protein